MRALALTLLLAAPAAAAPADDAARLAAARAAGVPFDLAAGFTVEGFAAEGAAVVMAVRWSLTYAEAEDGYPRDLFAQALPRIAAVLCDDAELAAHLAAGGALGHVVTTRDGHAYHSGRTARCR